MAGGDTSFQAQYQGKSTDPHPKITYYPKCSQCGLAFVLRRCLSMSQGWIWLWARDCKHKKAEPEVVAPDEE